MLLTCHSMKRDIRKVRYPYCSITEWNHLLSFVVDNCIFVIRVKYQVKFLVKPETLLGEPDLLEGARADHRRIVCDFVMLRPCILFLC
jgi:hypothetical protein